MPACPARVRNLCLLPRISAGVSQAQRISKARLPDLCAACQTIPSNDLRQVPKHPTSNIWHSLALPGIHGILWHCLAFTGIAWHSWHSLALPGILWHCLAFMAFMALPGILWHCLAFMAFMALPGILWHCLAFTGIAWHSWHSLAFMAFLAFSGIYWHCLALPGILGILGIRRFPSPRRMSYFGNILAQPVDL